MKVRIFFFKDQNPFSGQIINSLTDLVDTSDDFLNGWYYLHLGFQPPKSEEIEASLIDRPFGLYCSKAFRDSNPGNEWRFSDRLDHGLHNLGIYLITKCSKPGYFIKDDGFSLKKTINNRHINKTRVCNSESELIGRFIKDDVLLEDHYFSPQTKKLFQELNLIHASDLAKLSKNNLRSLSGVSAQTIREAEHFLQKHDLKLGSIVILRTAEKNSKNTYEDKKQDYYLSDFNFSVRTTNIFKYENITLVSQLVNYSEAELFRIKNCGRLTVSEVKKFLIARGLELGGSYEFFEPQNLRSSKPKSEVFEDKFLTEFDFSIRTVNVFERENIRLLSELVKFTEAKLLSTPNFGKKSLVEINKFLNEQGLKLGKGDYYQFSKTAISVPITHSSLIGSDIVEDIETEFKRSESDPRRLEIALNRCGISGKKTLEELGSIFDITRERIRQLERKTLDKIFRNKHNMLLAWYRCLRDLILDTPYPVDMAYVGSIDKRLEATENHKELIPYIIYWVNKLSEFPAAETTINVIAYKNKKFVSNIPTEEILQIETNIIKVLENSPKALLDKLKQDAEKYITEAQRSFFEYIWAINLNDCLISHDGQQPEFIKYVKKSLAERAFANLLEFTEGSDHPVSTAQLEEEHQKSGIGVTFGSVRNLILQSNDIFPTKHGKYGSFKHINFDKNDQNKILTEAKSLLELSETNQIHTREILKRLEGTLTADLNMFEVTAILNKFSNLQYLGRCVFAKKDTKVTERIFLHDTFINILRDTNRPMHQNELKQEARKYVSVSETLAIVPKPPLVNLGKGTYALDYWDDDVLGAYANVKFKGLSHNHKEIWYRLRQSAISETSITMDLAIRVAEEQYAANKDKYARLINANSGLEALVKVGLLEQKADTYIFVDN